MSTTRSRSVNREFGNWLKHQLLSRDLNQSEFALKMGVGHSTVSRWVSGRSPEARFLEQIADVLFVDYDLVATRAGYRPVLPDIDPASREAEVLGLVHRINWERQGEGVEMVVDMLHVLAKRLPKPKER